MNVTVKGVESDLGKTQRQIWDNDQKILALGQLKTTQENEIANLTDDLLYLAYKIRLVQERMRYYENNLTAMQIDIDEIQMHVGLQESWYQ